MEVILRMIDAPEVVPLLALIGLLTVIGSSMIVSWPRLKKSGTRAACGLFLAYCAYASATFEPRNANDMLWIVVRGVFAFGLSRAALWIALSVAGFINDRAIQPHRYRRPVSRWDDTPLALPAPLQPAPIVHVVENKQPVVHEETVIEKVKGQRSDYEARLEVLDELREVAGLDDDLIEELQGKELERYLRKVTNVLDYS